MHPPGADTVLVRYGELGLKSEQVRRMMSECLSGNIAAMLGQRGVTGTVDDERDRIYVRTDDPEAATDAVADVFGVVSASPAVSVAPTLDAITAALAEAAIAHYTGGTFAVDAHRAGPADAHDFSSKELEAAGGRAVWEAVDFEPTVDLDDPDVTVHVEARPHEAFVFLETRDGPGGLPLGTQEPMVALVSGGIDSPVAAWRVMKRGVPVFPVYIDLGEYGGPDHRARALSTVADVARYAPGRDMRLRVVPAGDAVARLVDELDDLRMLALRRFMLRAAEQVARDVDAVGIVTGESVGQKSSQTTANLAVTSVATDLPVHRPLLTVDKTTITQQARAIDTFEDATISTGCNRVAPSLPETAATLDAVRAAEPDDLFDLASDGAAAVEVVELPAR